MTAVDVEGEPDWLGVDWTEHDAGDREQRTTGAVSNRSGGDGGDLSAERGHFLCGLSLVLAQLRYTHSAIYTYISPLPHRSSRTAHNPPRSPP